MTSERLQADYLTCPLCTNPFHQPKTLPCLHNFCKACLSSYLEEEMSGGKGTTFQCPDCKDKTYVPDPSKAVNRWASQFPTNFVLTGMIEAIAEEEKGEGDGEKVKAAKDRRGGRADDHSPNRAARAEEDSDSTSLQGRLAKLQKSTKDDDAELEFCLKEMDVSHQEQTKRLEMSFSRIVELIEFRKIQLLEELEDNYKEEKKRIQQAKQLYQHDIESLNTCEELMDGLENKNLKASVAENMVEAIEEQVREIETRPTKVVARAVRFEQKLESGRSVLNLIENLGAVTITSAGEAEKVEGDEADGDDGEKEVSVAKLFAKPKFVTKISASSEEKQQQVQLVTVMPSGNVIMTVYGENALLVARDFGNQEYKVFSHLSLQSEPKSIVSISQHYVVVISNNCFYIVGVTAEHLIMKQRVETGKNYNGICSYNESNLVCTSPSPPSVDFVGLNGFISESVQRDLTTNTILFRNPQYIATSQEGVIYVIDQSSKGIKLLGINNAGKIQFTFPSDGNHEFKMPQGVVCDSLGHIYVVDRETQTVTLLTPAGEKVRDILTAEDGLSDPCAIAIDKEDKLYVTNNFSEVLVYQTR